MKILLIQPPTGRRFIKEGAVTPPLGLPYLSAVLKKRGEDVFCIDADSEDLSLDQISQRILFLRPDLVGFSVNTPSVNNSIKIIKNSVIGHKFISVAGGPHATVLPEELLGKGFDYVVRGEGEETFCELIDFLKNKKLGDIGGIFGLSYKISGNFLHNQERKLIENLDSLPFPEWSLFPLDIYRSIFKKTKFTLPVMTSRGCPGRCTFCYKGVFGVRFRVRSPENVVEEIKYLKNQYGIDGFDILDDSFTSIPKRAIEICRLIVSEKINLPWGIPSGIRVDTVSDELFGALREAGCYRVGFGVESGNDYILQTIKKNITKDQVRKAVDMAKKYGFQTECFFLVGNLKETEKTIDDTISFAKELNPDIAQFGIATPYPGTEMFNILKEENRILTDDWDKYDSFAGDDVFVHENLTGGIIRNKFKKAYRSYYFRPKYIYKKLRLLKNKNEREKLFKSFFSLIKLLKSAKR